MSDFSSRPSLDDVFHHLQAIEPLGDRILVFRDDCEEKSPGGLFIPDNAKDKPIRGTVVAVGKGGRKDSGEMIPMCLKPKDRIIFGKWSGTEVKIHGIDIIIMKESDVMALDGSCH